MDADKLNEAAGKDWCENVLDRDLKPITKQAFKRGADWLMQQPLADRLTNEEKEKIKAIYFRNVYSVADVQSNFTEKCLIDAIFGAELFNGK
ncbi:MAG: hypothetical protein K2K82_00685 [Muribaculaceae bacterium]|nr:hypothetical protein [Muribaculaceae bacterium]